MTTMATQKHGETQPGRSSRLSMAAVAATLVLVATQWGPMTPALASRAGINQCRANQMCVSRPHGLLVRFFYPKSGPIAVMTGWNWQPNKPLLIEFTQYLSRLSAHLSSVTGLVVRADGQGHFRVALPGEGPCGLLAIVTAGYPAGPVERLPRPPMCMEHPSPNPPVERFHVTTGRYVRSIFLRDHWSRRYVLPLGMNLTTLPALTDKQAVGIARRHFHVRKGASATVISGMSGFGPAGLETRVSEVIFGPVHVPHYGMGHKIVILIDQKIRFGIRPGTLVAAWNAP